VHNQGRAVDVTLWEGTQDPTDQNLPKLVREGAHTRASLVPDPSAAAPCSTICAASRADGRTGVADMRRRMPRSR
ncbi:hypothetical protein DLE01_26850, partial [Streptomyces sp. FT05W]